MWRRRSLVAAGLTVAVGAVALAHQVGHAETRAHAPGPVAPETADAAPHGGAARTDAAASDGGADAGTDADAASNMPAAVPDGAGAGGRGTGGDALAPDGSGDAAPVPLLTLAVRVLERGTRRPLGAAVVTVDGHASGETAEDGRALVAVGPGLHDVEVRAPGYVSFGHRLRTDQLVSGTTMVVSLAPEETEERYQTEVRGRRVEVPTFSLPGQEARSAPGASGDPVRVLASLPGVSQIAWPAGVFVVRGSNPGNTGFFVDGIRVPAMFHLALGPSIIHPSLVGGLDFYPGAYPENFGRYVAGIVSIRTTTPPEDRAHVLASVTLYDAGGVVTVPVHGGRGAVTAAARYSYTGPLLSLFDPNTSLAYGDYQLRLDHLLWGGRATVFAFGSFDQLDWTTTGAGRETAALQYHRLDLRWLGAAAGGRLQAAATLGLDRARSTLYGSPISVTSTSLAPRVLFARPLSSHLELELGADAELQHFDAHPAAFQGKQSDLARSRNALSQGTYAAARLQAAGRLFVTPGVRADLFVEEGTSRFVVQPRLNARLNLGTDLALKLNAGRFTQMASLPVSVAGFEAFGLASIGLQRSDAVSSGIETPLPGNNQLDVTGFFQRMQVTDIRNLDITQMMPTRDDYLAMRAGVGYGVEVLLRRPAGQRTYGWIAYTLSWSFRNVEGATARSDWDQRHILNLVAGRRLPNRFTVGTRLHLNTGRNAPLFDQAGSYRQLPTYYQVDLRAERRFLFDRFILDVFVDVANATFNRQLIQYTPTTAGPQPAYLRLILPTIGVHGEF